MSARGTNRATPRKAPSRTRAAASTADVQNVAPLAPAERAALLGQFEQGVRALADEWPSAEDLELVRECLEYRDRVVTQPTPAARVEKLQTNVDDAKEAAEIEDGSAGYIDALKRVIAHALVGIREARAIEARQTEDYRQPASADDFSQVRR